MSIKSQDSQELGMVASVLKRDLDGTQQYSLMHMFFIVSPLHQKNNFSTILGDLVSRRNEDLYKD